MQLNTPPPVHVATLSLALPQNLIPYMGESVCSDFLCQPCFPATSDVQHWLRCASHVQPPRLYPPQPGRRWGSHVALAAARRQQHEAPRQLPHQHQQHQPHQHQHSAFHCRSDGGGSRRCRQACSRRSGRALRPRWRRPLETPRRRTPRHSPRRPTFQRCVCVCVCVLCVIVCVVKCGCVFVDNGTTVAFVSIMRNDDLCLQEPQTAWTPNPTLPVEAHVI